MTNGSKPSINHGLVYQRQVDSSQRTPISLISVNVQADTADLNANVQIVQKFSITDAQITPDSLVDLIYLFPMPDFVIVTQFSCDINGVKTAATIVRNHTISIQSAAAVHCQTVDDNTFECKLGTLSSNAVIEVSLAYSTVLRSDQLKKVFVVPRCVVPSYVLNSNTELTLSLAVTTSSRIETVTCSSHPHSFVMKNLNGNQATANVTMRCNMLDTDMLIHIVSRQHDYPRCVFQVHPVSGEVACSVTLPCALSNMSATAELASEYVFLLDCSTSMTLDVVQPSEEVITLRKEHFACMRAEKDKCVSLLNALETAKAKSLKLDDCISRFNALESSMDLPQSVDMFEIAHGTFAELKQSAGITSTSDRCADMFDEFVTAWDTYDSLICPISLQKLHHNSIIALARKKECYALYDSVLPIETQTRFYALKQAMHLILKSLPVNSKFQTIRFGSTFHPLFPDGPIAYDDLSLSQAAEHIKGMKADLPRSELLESLKFALNQRSAIPRSVFVITDGQVSKVDQVLSLVASHASDTRVFSIGIGSKASWLCEKLAQAGHGECRLVSNDVPASLVDLVKVAVQPTFTNITVDWRSINCTGALEMCPRAPPAVFQGTRIQPYALHCTLPAYVIERVKSGQVICDFDCKVTVEAFDSLTGEKRQWKVGPSVVCQGISIHTQAARARIDELEQLSGSSSTSFISANKEIEQLANRIGLPSRTTSLMFGADQTQQPIKAKTDADLSPPAILAVDHTSSYSDFDQLVELQTASGLWEPTDALIEVVNAIDPAIGTALKSGQSGHTDVSQAVLKVLQAHFVDRKGCWQLIETKAVASIDRKQRTLSGDKKRNEQAKRQAEIDSKFLQLEAQCIDMTVSAVKRSQAMIALKAMRDNGDRPSSESLATSVARTRNIKRK